MNEVLRAIDRQGINIYHEHHQVAELIKVLAISPGRPRECLKSTCECEVALNQGSEKEAIPAPCHIVIDF